ncbi:MAG: hypothetical protein DRN66_01085 [Candidatus Nanohalarchaeota archaeon]|nr:MAG: hypothetical protein DRN66_01085 [Candidatus Nanohaloarchaeota archaeon]
MNLKSKGAITLKLIIVLLIILIGLIVAYNLFFDKDSHFKKQYDAKKGAEEFQEYIEDIKSAKTAEDIVEICKKNSLCFTSCIKLSAFEACEKYDVLTREECINTCKKIIADEKDKDKNIIVGQRYECFNQLLHKYGNDEKIQKYADMAKRNLPCNGLKVESIEKNKDNTITITMSSKYDFKPWSLDIVFYNDGKYIAPEKNSKDNYVFEHDKKTIITASEQFKEDAKLIDITLRCDESIGLDENEKRYSLEKKVHCNLQTQNCIEKK